MFAFIFFLIISIPVIFLTSTIENQYSKDELARMGISYDSPLLYDSKKQVSSPRKQANQGSNNECILNKEQAGSMRSSVCL